MYVTSEVIKIFMQGMVTTELANTGRLQWYCEVWIYFRTDDVSWLWSGWYM